MHIEIVVPHLGPVAVEAEVRHGRPFRQPFSGRRGWATGLALATADPDFLSLTRPGGRAERSEREGVVEVLRAVSGSRDPARSPRRAASPRTSARGAPDLLVAEQSLYRVRLKALGSARTRTLLLRAVSEAAVCDAVLRDLPGDWEVLGVEVDPID